MKRKLLVLFMAASAMVSVSAQEQQKIDYSHWSVNLKGGLDYTRYELGESGIMTSDNLGYALGLGIEYTINPLLGFGAEYAYMAHETGLADATANDISVYGSVNLLNLVVPNRPGCWHKFNIYGNVGAGYGFYAYNIDGGGSGDVEAPLTTYAVNAEYALSDSWALGLETQYVDYSREDLTRSVTPYLGSDAFNVSLNLRFKFGANGDKKHVRNTTRNEYYGETAIVPFDSKPLVQADNTLSNRLAAAENNNKALSDKIAKLESDLKDMAKKNAEQPDGKKCDVNASFDNIEFGFGTAVIDKASYATLDQVAEVLKNNKAWSKLEIGGNADNIGDSNYNLTLSQKRAEAVKAYLVNKGLSESALIAKGYGEENPIATNDTPEGRQQNRRVDFKISK